MSIELEAPISSVTVYTDRARITRSNEVALPTGESVLLLSGLPSQMDRESVRVSGKGAGITIRGVDVKRDVQEGADSSKPLRDQQKSLQQEILAIQHQLQALEEQLAYYRALKSQTSEEAGTALLKQDTSFERVTQIADYIREQIEHVFERQRTLTSQKDDLDQQLEKINWRLAQGESADSRAGQAIHIAVEAEGETTFAYDIEYVVKDASWKPLYNVRLLEDNSVELSYMAQITQETGEDWNDVNLALSTARPALTNTLPDPKAWYISNARPYKARKATQADAFAEYAPSVMPASDANVLEQSRRMLGPLNAAMKSPKPQAKVKQAVVESSSSGAVVTYKIGNLITIPGNGEPHKTTVTITGLKAELDYVCVPRIAQEAYLRATITNTSEFTILPGEASIFHENDFVGKTQLETIAPTEEFEVQLGVDDRIKIKRDLLTRDTSKSMIGIKQQLYFRYAVEITNLLQKSTKITVQDQYPLSQESDVKVKLESVSPQPQDETDLHIITWELALPEGKTRTIEIAFSVEFGRGDNVYGLDD